MKKVISYRAIYPARLLLKTAYCHRHHLMKFSWYESSAMIKPALLISEVTLTGCRETNRLTSFRYHMVTLTFPPFKGDVVSCYYFSDRQIRFAVFKEIADRQYQRRYPGCFRVNGVCPIRWRLFILPSEDDIYVAIWLQRQSAVAAIFYLFALICFLVCHLLLCMSVTIMVAVLQVVIFSLNFTVTPGMRLLAHHGSENSFQSSDASGGIEEHHCCISRCGVVNISNPAAGACLFWLLTVTGSAAEREGQYASKHHLAKNGVTTCWRNFWRIAACWRDPPVNAGFRSNISALR